MPSTPRFRRLTLIAKLVLAGAILAFLLHQVRQQDGFARLVEQDKDWASIALGVGCILACVTLSFVRWHILVRALDLPFRLVDALRLGAIGYALNFVALGSVGGDVFKAVFIARGQPGRRTAAVATILVDRGLGLFTFMVLASLAVLVMRLDMGHSTEVTLLCRATLVATAIALGVIMAALCLPGLTGDRLQGLVGRLPLLGSIGIQLLMALQSYRNRRWQLLGAFLLSVVVDTLFIVSFYLVAAGLPLAVPTLAEHFLIVPLSLVAGSIPITPSGIGTFEAAVNKLYQIVPSGGEIMPGTGTLTALAHRAGTVAVAAIAVAFYLTQRGQIAPAAKNGVVTKA